MKPSSIAPSIYERSQKLSNALQCPYCNRKFSEKAGSRHIAYCKEKAELLRYKESTPKTKIQKPTPTASASANATPVNYDTISQRSQQKDLLVKRVSSSQVKTLKFNKT